MSKCGNRNKSFNNYKKDIITTQSYIASLQTSQPDKNRINAQVQISHMGRQREGYAVDTNNYASVTGLGSPKRFSIKYDHDGIVSSILI